MVDTNATNEAMPEKEGSPDPKTGTSTPDASSEGVKELTPDELINQPAVQKHIQGLLKNKNEILEEKKKQESQLREMSERAKVLDSLGGQEGVDRLLALQRQLEADDDTKLFETDKEAYNKRITSRLRETMQGQVDELNKQLTESKQRLSDQESRIHTLMINSKVDRLIASQPDVMPWSIPHIKRLVRDKFHIDEETGREVARDADTDRLEFGSDGQPLTIKEWFETQLPKEAPGFFRGQSGIGSAASTSSTGGNGTARVPYTAEQLKDVNVWAKLKAEYAERGEPFPPPGGFIVASK